MPAADHLCCPAHGCSGWPGLSLAVLSGVLQGPYAASCVLLQKNWSPSVLLCAAQSPRNRPGLKDENWSRDENPFL